MKLYRILGDNYECTAADAETVCNKAGKLLSKAISDTAEVEAITRKLLNWCRTAKDGESFIHDEFTVIVSFKKVLMPYPQTHADTSVFQDCMEELKKCNDSDPFSRKWLDKFVRSFKLPENSRFNEAYNRLNLSLLPVKVQGAFWSLAKNFLLRFTFPYSSPGCSMKDSDYIEEEATSFRDCVDRLISEGLVNVTTFERNDQLDSSYCLSVAAVRVLFRDCEEVIKYDELAKYAQIVTCRDIKKKELFFSAESQVEIDRLRKLVSREGFRRAAKILADKKRPESIQSLLWGPPGTGKTETVKQLALESGRDIIMFDMARVTHTLWGATEQSYRALFREYAYIAAVSRNVPILLMNEADDILCKRITMVERAIDKSENTVANILLQEIESMNGILIATTNLIDNMDEAFDRRFLFKTQLTKPDAAARAKIWKSSIPELSDADAVFLAESFEMSGAQISNVVARRDLAELYFDGDRGTAYIRNLCLEELSAEKRSGNAHPRIGYVM